MRRRSPRQDSWGQEPAEKKRERNGAGGEFSEVLNVFEENIFMIGTRDLGKRKRDFANDEGVVDRKHRRRDDDGISTRTNRLVEYFPSY